MSPTVVPGVGEYVDPSTTYCDLTELKAELGITDSADDDKLNAAIAAASRQVDGFCGRRFWADSTVQVRVFEAASSARCFVDDISTSTGLVVAVDSTGDGTYASTLTVDDDFVLAPFNAAQQIPVWPYTELRLVPAAARSFPVPSQVWPQDVSWPGVRVTAKFGWAAVPSDVDKATCIQAAQLFKSKDAVFGVAGVSDLGVLRVRESLNPLAAGLLAPYRRVVIA